MAMAGILSAHPQALPREALGLSKSITDALYGSSLTDDAACEAAWHVGQRAMRTLSVRNQPDQDKPNQELRQRVHLHLLEHLQHKTQEMERLGQNPQQLLQPHENVRMQTNQSLPDLGHDYRCDCGCNEFTVSVFQDAIVTYDGLDMDCVLSEQGDVPFDDGHYATCNGCGAAGTLGSFAAPYTDRQIERINQEMERAEREDGRWSEKSGGH